ncbi:MAG: chemotaxis protein CheA [Planctomycetia bacterium]|nr:chemotaxis protein CheA [Planctomycetia bacterium]
MGARTSYQNAVEDLKAMILAADPRDSSAVARVGAQVEEILAMLQPEVPEYELLSLVLSALRSGGSLDSADGLRVVTGAVAELSQQDDPTQQGQTAPLDAAAGELRKLLDAISGQSGDATPLITTPPQASSEAPATSGAQFVATSSAAVEVDAELLAEFIHESFDRIAWAEAATLLLEKDPRDAEAINTVLRAFHTIKGAAGLLGFSAIQHLAHHAEGLLIRGRDGEVTMTGPQIELALKAGDALKSMVKSLENRAPGQAPEIPVNYHALLGAFSEPDRNTAAVTAVTNNAPQVAAFEASDLIAEIQADDFADASPTNGPSCNTASTAEASVRVNTERLDNLVNLVGELAIAQAMVARDSRAAESNSARLERSVSAVEKIIRQLQDLAMSLRMVPLKGTFQKMNRLVRDLGHKSDKEIRFEIAGDETEIDRNMVEALCDPLSHMIRNAVDHGIEPAEMRIAQGKSPSGTLHLRAYHAAGHVVIELEDDGRGLNRQRIVERAILRGLIQPDHHLSDDEAHFLIFHPGLSTAENVTEISGRGVGMDVVKRSIEALRGRIEVATQSGAGTRFTLRLPLTTAIIDAMSIRVGGQQYLLPTVVIQRSFRPEPGSISTVAGRGEMVRFGDQMLPLFRLHRLFSVADAQQDPERALVVVIEGDGRRSAVLVDELLGQQQAVMKSLGDSLTKVSGVAGGAILSDGRVGLILDAVGLVQLAYGGNLNTRTVSAPERN